MRTYVFADASAASKVDHTEKLIDSMFPSAMADGEPAVRPRYQLAGQ